ncbi:MAG: radical SAM protein [Planctomycetes bacterium]|nr:radical SAM protein [Planctomycetota bacterium]
MLTLINTNRMAPLVAPIGLDYVAAAARGAGIRTEVLDLAPAADPASALRRHFASARPRLVGVTFRNVDDCFWPSAGWFVPALGETVAAVRALTDAPIVVGGVGFSIFAEEIVRQAGADFGVRGDGEEAVVRLYRELQGSRPRPEAVPGLVWRDGGRLRSNPPAWGEPLAVPAARDAIDNAAYFRLGGQGAVETKRGCDRRCLYCADPLAKGPRVRLRDPREAADEVAALAGQGVDVLHLADSEFNLPRDHATAVCEELVRRGLGRRVRWYAYLAVRPFDAALADAMRRAGCAGINFTADSAAEAMLAAYRQPHGRDEIAQAVRLCRERGMAVMLDLLLGGPDETPATAAETIRFVKRADPDCAGAALGVRIYPHTAMYERLAAGGPLETNPGLRRRYGGPVDLVRPTFYISPALGERPAALVRDLIGGDPRFFEPAEEAAPAAAAEAGAAGYNYNDNTPLVEAISSGARGAYWHILRQMRGGRAADAVPATAKQRRRGEPPAYAGG